MATGFAVSLFNCNSRKLHILKMIIYKEHRHDVGANSPGLSKRFVHLTKLYKMDRNHGNWVCCFLVQLQLPQIAHLDADYIQGASPRCRSRFAWFVEAF